MEKNIIVRMPNWLGDFIMAIPILLDLRQAFKDAKITAMCVDPLGSLLLQEKSIDEIFSFQKPRSRFLIRKEERDIIEKLQEGEYDLGILLPNSFSSAWWFFCGRVKRRLGYTNFWRHFLLTDHAIYPKNIHQVDVYKRLLSKLGIKESATLPRLILTKEEIDRSKELLYQRGYKKEKLLIGFNAAAAYGLAKCWPKDRFEKLTAKLLENPDLFVVFFGDEKVSSFVKDICRNFSTGVINLAGLTTLRELASIIQQCDVMVTNDSGPMHMAAALEVPLVALFGSTSEKLTGPYHVHEEILSKRVPCSPCFRRKPCREFICMKQIEVDEVYEAIERQLKRRKTRV